MTQLSKPGQAVIDALLAVLDKAPEAERNALAQAIEDYARERPRTFRSLQRKGGLLVEVLETMIEGTDARPDPVTAR